MKTFAKNLLFSGYGTSTKTGDVGLAVLRVGIGLLIGLGHGGSKLYHGGQFGPPAPFVSGVASLGFPHPEFFAWCSTLTEFLGGLLLAAGLLTRPAALLLVFNMCVAVFGQHLHNPIFSSDPHAVSKELALLYLLPTFCILLIGAGRISIDRIIRGV
ncbi:MAG TPA: DoxX family protein [Tepidisphaeraceae bacterium]|jgi:putative oxidoreductase